MALTLCVYLVLSYLVASHRCAHSLDLVIDHSPFYKGGAREVGPKACVSDSSLRRVYRVILHRSFYLGGFHSVGSSGHCHLHLRLIFQIPHSRAGGRSYCFVLYF